MMRLAPYRPFVARAGKPFADTYAFPATSVIVPVSAERDWMSSPVAVSPDVTLYVQVNVVDAVTAGQVAGVSVVPVSRRSEEAPVVVTGSENVTVIETVPPTLLVPDAAVVIVETVGGIASHAPLGVATVAVDATGDAVALVGKLSFDSKPDAPAFESVRVSVLPGAAMVTFAAVVVPKSAVPEDEMGGSLRTF